MQDFDRSKRNTRSAGGEMIIPGGLVSEADLKDVKFFVQTEFAQRPKPRVTTTISLNGEVVDKVENVWERLPQTEEEREEIERFLKRQHHTVLEKIKHRREKSDSPSCETDVMASSEEAMIGRINRELSGTDGVIGWVYISRHGKMKAHRLSEPETNDIGKLAGPIRDLYHFLPPVADLGDLTGSVLDYPGNLKLFLPVETYLLVVKLDTKVDFKNLISKIKSATKVK
jgi:hypothetical protein